MTGMNLVNLGASTKATTVPGFVHRKMTLGALQGLCKGQKSKKMKTKT